MATRGKTTLALCLRFLLAAPVCLILWLLALPSYAWLLGHVTAAFLKHVLRLPVHGVIVKTEGFLNTGTQITYEYGSVLRTLPGMGQHVVNVAPFVALVLATPGLKMARRLKILAVGIGILVFVHGATLVTRFVQGRTPLEYAIGMASVTLPFLLWIILAYWDKLTGYFWDDEPPQP